MIELVAAILQGAWGGGAGALAGALSGKKKKQLSTESEQPNERQSPLQNTLQAVAERQKQINAFNSNPINRFAYGLGVADTPGALTHQDLYGQQFGPYTEKQESRLALANSLINFGNPDMFGIRSLF